MPAVQQASDAMQTLPAQVGNAGVLLLGLIILFYAYKLVRPLNFVAGAWLGVTFSLILMTIFAPYVTACVPIVVVGTACGLLLGVLAAMSRISMFLQVLCAVGPTFVHALASGVAAV